MKHIPLKQYVDSKRQLLSAIERTPTSIMEYEIRKYCTIPLGEEGEADVIALKPKHVVVVEWVYHDPQHPTPEKITVLDKDQRTVTENHEVFWSGDKLNKWLMRYAKSGISAGHNL